MSDLKIITYHGDNFDVEETELLDGEEVKTKREYHLERKKRDLLNVN